MIQQNILAALQKYTTPYNDEALMLRDTINFIRNYPDCFERSNLGGHVTGSAWILNEAYTHAMLIHHVKLNKWFQPGGHCDGDPDVLFVAQKEAHEETGLIVESISKNIFDVDVHVIPEKNGIPEHLHYDIRYAFKAPMDQMNLSRNREIMAGKWIPLSEIVDYNNSPSILRLVTKTETMFNL